MTTPKIQLITAIFADDAVKIRSLLEGGEINANDCDFFNLPPLLRAALYGKSRALKVLLQFGADKNIKDQQGRTALQVAKKYNHQKIIDILLQEEILRDETKTFE